MHESRLLELDEGIEQTTRTTLELSAVHPQSTQECNYDALSSGAQSHSHITLHLHRVERERDLRGKWQPEKERERAQAGLFDGSLLRCGIDGWPK